MDENLRKDYERCTTAELLRIIRRPSRYTAEAVYIAREILSARTVTSADERQFLEMLRPPRRVWKPEMTRRTIRILAFLTVLGGLLFLMNNIAGMSMAPDEIPVVETVIVGMIHLTWPVAVVLLLMRKPLGWWITFCMAATTIFGLVVMAALFRKDIRTVFRVNTTMLWAGVVVAVTNWLLVFWYFM